jgi:hypothetical protein
LFREVVGPGLLLGVYGVVLMAMLPSGLNRQFAMALALAASAVVTGVVVVSIVSGRARRFGAGETDNAGSDVERAHRSDVWLLLLPMAPVVQYMVLNRDTLSWFGVFVSLAALGGLAALLALMVPYLVRRTMSRTAAWTMRLTDPGSIRTPAGGVSWRRARDRGGIPRCSDRSTTCTLLHT